jgi:hypothetical protein
MGGGSCLPAALPLSQEISVALTSNPVPLREGGAVIQYPVSGRRTGNGIWD